jgi:hypothetical protein
MDSFYLTYLKAQAHTKGVEKHKKAVDAHTERASEHEEAALGYIEEGNVEAATREAKLARDETLKAIESCKNMLAELQKSAELISGANEELERDPNLPSPTQDADTN